MKMIEESDPSISSTYRNIQYRVYDLGSIGEIGFIKIGDMWKKVLGVDDEYENITDEMEQAIDEAIDLAMEHDDDGTLFDRYDEQFPDIDPGRPGDEEPYTPAPWEDTWSITDTLNTLVDGTTRFK